MFILCEFFVYSFHIAYFDIFNSSLADGVLPLD